MPTQATLFFARFLARLTVALLGAAAVFIALSTAPPSALRAAELKDARQAMNDNNFPRAVEILDARLAEHPSDHRALALRGEAHLDIYSPDAPTKALADLNRAIEIQPAKNGHDLFIRGRAYKNLGDYDKALADLNKAIELAPDDAERYFHRGNTHYCQKDFEGAVRDLSKAIELDPKYVLAYIARGHVQWHRGTKSRPVVYKQGDNTYEAFQFESVVDRGLVDQALTDLTKAVELAPDDPDGYLCRASFYRDLKDWPRYLADMKHFVRLNPQNSQASNELAWFLATIDDDALRDGKTAAELAEKNCESSKHEDPVSLDTLAAALAESRKFKRAVETQEKAIAKLGDSPEFKQAFEKRLEEYRRKKPLRITDPSTWDMHVSSSDTAGRLPGPRKRRREAELNDAEQALFRAINTARKERGLKPLSIHPALVGVCRKHARTMVELGEAREEFDGKTPGEWISDAGVPGGGQWGITSGRGASADALVDEWTNSSIAKANILNVDVNQMGIGTAVDAEGNIYALVAYVEIK